MKKVLYLECNSGISGDMTVAALLDLGADQEKMENAIASLPVDGFRTRVSRVKKAGLDACDFAVILDEAHENHDHDMEYLHGHDHEAHSHEIHSHEIHNHDHEVHNHDHEVQGHISEEHAHCSHTHGEHVHGAQDHHHEHRGMREIEEIVRRAQMTDGARSLCMKIFHILADAEAKAHGVPVDQVHFHEVGAVDSIVDIVAAAVCLDDLGIEETEVPELCEGRGTVRCQHGILPIPVPAVTNIVQEHGLRLHITETEGELVTPTGAAIAAAIRTTDRMPERFTIMKTGIGAGKRSYDRPSLLRAMILGVDEDRKEEQKEERKEHKEEQKEENRSSDRIYRLETNIDDCSGEIMGYVMNRLLEEGARDVSYTPVYMKKNRPAYQLNVICSPEDVEKLEEIIFRETTTIGIRKEVMERTILPRKIKTVSTEYGDADIKECILPDGSIRRYPEYKSAAEIAENNKISYQEAFLKILDAAR